MDFLALPEPVHSVSTLFHPLVAFFSPLVSASLRSSWTSHGGRLATHDAVRGDECDIDLYFALPGQPDELVNRSVVNRLEALDVELHSVEWVEACLRAGRIVGREPFRFSTLGGDSSSQRLTTASETVLSSRNKDAVTSNDTETKDKPARHSPSPFETPLSSAPPLNTGTSVPLAPAPPALSLHAPPSVLSTRLLSRSDSAASGDSDAAVEALLLRDRNGPRPLEGFSTAAGGEELREDEDDEREPSTVDGSDDEEEAAGVVLPLENPQQQQEATTESFPGDPPQDSRLSSLFDIARMPSDDEDNCPAFNADLLLSHTSMNRRLTQSPSDIRHGFQVIEHAQGGFRVQGRPRDCENGEQ